MRMGKELIIYGSGADKRIGYLLEAGKRRTNPQSSSHRICQKKLLILELINRYV